MVKKAIAIAGAGALLLSLAVPALGYNYGGGYGFMGGSNDVAMITNNVGASANSGFNWQTNMAMGGDSGNNNMTTGKATAYAGSLTIANTHVGCCAQPPCGYPCGGYGMGNQGESSSDFAWITNNVGASANSGYNMQVNTAMGGKDFGGGFGGCHHCGGSQGGSDSGNNNMTTGPANATARAWTIVNTHLEF